MLRSGGPLEAVHTGLARLVSRGNSRQDSGEVWGNALQSCPNFVGYSDRSVASAPCVGGHGKSKVSGSQVSGRMPAND